MSDNWQSGHMPLKRSGNLMQEALRRHTAAFHMMLIWIGLNIGLDKKSKFTEKQRERIVNTDVG